MIEQLKQLAQILSYNLRVNNFFISYNGRLLRMRYSTSEKENLIAVLNELKIDFELFPQDEIEIELNKCYTGNLVLFLDDVDYLKRAIDYLDNFNEHNFLILNDINGFLLKTSHQLFSSDCAIFFNAIYYRQLLNFITTNTDFVAVHNTTMYQFIIFSGDSGPFYIGYNLLDNRVKNLPDLSIYLLSIKEAFSKIDFIQFFKAALVQGVHQEDIKNRFFAITQSLQIILRLATKDYEIYLRQFAFDKIKAKFKDERNKYFESIEKNIETVSKQVTSFPLTFAASIFAGYQVKDRPAILILVFLAYGLYTFIAWKILSITSLNTDSIKEDVELEESKIKNGYQLIYEEFQPDFKKIKGKLSKLSALVMYLKTVLIGLLVAFIVFGIYQNISASKEKNVPIEVKIIK